MKINEILVEGFYKDLSIKVSELKNASVARLFVHPRHKMARLDLMHDDGSYDTLELVCTDELRFGKTIMRASYLNGQKPKSFKDAVTLLTGKKVSQTIIRLFLDWKPVGGKTVNL